MQALARLGRLSAASASVPPPITVLPAFTTKKIRLADTAASRISSLSRQFSSTSRIMAPISKETELLVIGGGSGGLGAARMASGKFGAKAMIVESNRLGGTCVNVGCVPKKVTFNAAAIAEAIHESKDYGFKVEATAPFDWTTFKTKRDAYVKRLNGIYERNLANDKIEYVHGRARLLSRNEVEITTDDGAKSTVRANRIVVAVGGRPASFPDIPGAEHGINSDGFFDIATLPKKVALVGAGYIAVEFAGMFNALGVETHLFIRHGTFLRHFDPMIQDGVTAEYERLGVHLHKHSSQSRVDKDPATGKLTVHYKDAAGEGKLEGLDHLIWAIGRVPETESLGLESAGVKVDGKGYVVVDDFQNTSVDNVFALGDVCGKVELTPVAIAAGRRLAERLYGPPALFANARLDYSGIPSVVFAHPEVGSIGLTEPQAVEKYGADNIKVYKTNFTAMYYAMMDPEDKGPTKYKVICQGPDEKVVGLHIMGLGSGEMLQGFGVALKMGATKKDLDSCVAIHPTSAEELVTLR
ncbi:putative glutathione protein [Nemania sp. NC0429]|nr:putative glutathione protein [Nemania sp. NC0429]